MSGDGGGGPLLICLGSHQLKAICCISSNILIIFGGLHNNTIPVYIMPNWLHVRWQSSKTSSASCVRIIVQPSELAKGHTAYLGIYASPLYLHLKAPPSPLTSPGSVLRVGSPGRYILPGTQLSAPSIVSSWYLGSLQGQSWTMQLSLNWHQQRISKMVSWSRLGWNNVIRKS